MEPGFIHDTIENCEVTLEMNHDYSSTVFNLDLSAMQF